MPQIIASGVAQADSSDIVLASGTSTTISLFTAAGVALSSDGRASVQIKSSGGVYQPLSMGAGTLGVHRRELVISGPGTYNVRKFPSGTAFGVDQD